MVRCMVYISGQGIDLSNIKERRKIMPVVKTYIHNSELYHDLKKMDRSNFSYDGACALMEYLKDLSEEIGENIEYDPIAFCCDFTEYETIGMLCDDYSNAPQADDYSDPDDWEEAAKEWLRDNTQVIEFDGGIIIQAF
jgi:hypothetical protein